MGQVHENRRLRRQGKTRAKLVISNVSQISHVKLGLGQDALEAVAQLRDRHQDKQSDDNPDEGKTEHDL